VLDTHNTAIALMMVHGGARAGSRGRGMIGPVEAARPPAQVLSYARRLSDTVGRALGGRLRAAYLHGSAVLGGWLAERSDVDILFVTEGAPRGRKLDALAGWLAAGDSDCPGRGLECSVVTVAQARRPRAPWPFVLHVARGSGSDQPRVVRGAGRAGDPDLLLHYAVCRAAGWPVYGPGPRELIGSVPRAVILGRLADELAWGLEHGSEAYAVLNAGRAQIFLADDELVSKIRGGRLALARGLGLPAVLRRALDQQQGQSPEQAVGRDAADYILAVATALRSAAAEVGRPGTSPRPP
jgi:hypothetical protein